jgi:hypothetical protein
MKMSKQETDSLTPFELDVFIGNFIRQREKEDRDRKK